MADFGPGYDPTQANYLTADDQAIGALIGLAALGMIGIGAFFAVELTVAEIEVSIGDELVIGINGGEYFGVTQAEADLFDTMETAEGQYLTADEATQLNELSNTGDGAPLFRDTAVVVALDQYDDSFNQDDANSMNDYLDNSVSGDCYSDPPTYCEE
jgi:hypothetical protein